jgi:hypothetical protein
MTPTTPTDDELRDLLAATFSAHEHLADPERAVEIATTPAPPSHRGRLLLAVAASVALVAVGTTYAVSQGSGSGEPATPATSGQPPLPPLQTDAGNRALAEAAAVRVAAALPAYSGAQETDSAGVPELGDDTLSVVSPGGHTIVRSRYWTVAGVRSRAVAEWYAAHPMEGFRTEGGPNGVGGSSSGSGWIDEVYWDGTSDNPSLSRTSVEIETTNTSAGVGIRLTVSSVWNPARPIASFVQDVSSIDVHSVHRKYGHVTHTTRRSFTVSDPQEILRAAIAFNELPGMTPTVHSCPMQMDLYTDRIVFHTATGDLTAVNLSSSSMCGSGMVVHRDGHRVNPELANVDQFLHVLGLDH